MGVRSLTCDNWYFAASSPCLYVGGYYNRNTNCGLFYVDRSSASPSGDNIGCRNLFAKR